MLRKFRGMRGLNEDEKYLFARSFAATPDERWQMHENFLRAHDLFTRSGREKYGLKLNDKHPVLARKINKGKRRGK